MYKFYISIRALLNESYFLFRIFKMLEGQGFLGKPQKNNGLFLVAQPLRGGVTIAFDPVRIKIGKRDLQTNYIFP